jgi:hypothetical protein
MDLHVVVVLFLLLIVVVLILVVVIFLLLFVLVHRVGGLGFALALVGATSPVSDAHTSPGRPTHEETGLPVDDAGFLPAEDAGLPADDAGLPADETGLVSVPAMVEVQGGSGEGGANVCGVPRFNFSVPATGSTHASVHP